MTVQLKPDTTYKWDGPAKAGHYARMRWSAKTGNTHVTFAYVVFAFRRTVTR